LRRKATYRSGLGLSLEGKRSRGGGGGMVGVFGILDIFVRERVGKKVT
jgi:hypothetical protein